MKKIPASKASFSEDDISYITEHFKGILSGNSYLSQYKYSQQFEKEFAEYVGTDFAVTCNSGTSALELIFRALEIKGKEVILPSNTFIATANAIMNAGGVLIFADCDDTMCLDYEDAISKVTSNTVAICNVHIGGIVSNSSLKLSEYCKENNINYVEDAAQAHGSSNKGKNAGTLGIAAGFSFYSTKVMTSGEGGIVTTNDEKLVNKMKSMREFGKEKKGTLTNYHTSIGYNWRMPEVSALMAIKQLESLDYFIKKRSEISSIYDSILENVKGISKINPPKDSRFNHFKYILILEGLSREVFHTKMEEKGIELSGYIYEIPLHKQPVFSEYQNISLPKTEKFCSKHVCLPIYPLLNTKDAEFIAENTIKILSNK